MKLQAVSLCLYYSDYLAATVANRRHFDRWVIVTVPEDRETIEFCREHELECLLSTTLREDGWDFDPKFRKASALNEALDQLDPAGWALILDADVLLPTGIRES
jgi:hypothetical protein